MRRKDREIIEPYFMHEILQEADVISVAFNTGEFPYVLPFNFVLYGDSIFIHCAPEGRKLDLIGRDPRVAFCAAVDIRVENTTTRYRSVCGTGIATLVDDDTLKIETLKALAAKYKAPCVFPIPERALAATRVVRVRVESMSGKHSRTT
ncbi:pyridoxamine 5'-phosphate oxidase family protein [Desulfomicrobium escambiense]|uniref:pyridoxamine 5'-phosphate oxidase family protein n=1 Tax=Desulfomicrobium escambiense TaxID=29503 RepID=UPI000416F2A8|nr:pyridoxamine 5'-phosphate oxidase family protein [Desulfomicrobium escambiense]